MAAYLPKDLFEKRHNPRTRHPFDVFQGSRITKCIGLGRQPHNKMGGACTTFVNSFWKNPLLSIWNFSINSIRCIQISNSKKEACTVFVPEYPHVIQNNNNSVILDFPPEIL